MEREKIPYEAKGQVLKFKMPKEVDHHVAQRLCREMDMLVESYQIRELLLDFKETEFMDSSGIGVVIGRSKKMKFRGGDVKVKNLGHRVDIIFQSAGLYGIVKKEED